MKKILLLAAATLIAASLASCTAIAETSAPDDSTPSPSQGPDTIEGPEPSFAEQPAPDTAVENLAFGEAATYDDGLSVSVSVPAPYTPSEYAAGADFPTNLAFTITITNNTGENLDAYAYAQITSGGAPGSQIFDGNTSYASGVILPGQSLSWEEHWSVADPNAIVFSIKPGFEYIDAVFTNVVG